MLLLNCGAYIRIVTCYLVTRQIICGFRIQYLDLLDIRQAKLQLIRTLSTMSNYDHDNTLNASVTALRKLQTHFSSFGTEPETGSRSHSQSHIVTDGQSVSKFWCRAPYRAARPTYYDTSIIACGHHLATADV
jgi:hypothetical protein